MSIPPPGAIAPPQPVHRGRLSPLKVVLFVGVGLAAILIVAYLAVLSNAPATAGPECNDLGECDPVTAPPLLNGTLFQGDLGWQLQFSPSYWKIVDQAGDAVQLQDVDGNPIFISIEAADGSTDPEKLLKAKTDALGETILGMEESTEAEVSITNPGVGDRHGPGAVYTGTVDSPQGPSTPVVVAVMAATDGDVTAVVAVVADKRNYGYAAQQADSILNTFLYPSEINV
jgi:hypothetical protein